MHKAFPLPGESSYWQYKFPLPVNVVPTARTLEMPAHDSSSNWIAANCFSMLGIWMMVRLSETLKRPTLGVKLLGGAVSQDARFICSLELMSLLPSLWDPQSELLLLRSCIGATKLLFGLRTCQPMYIGKVVSIFDNDLRRVIEAIVDHILQGCGIDGVDSDYGYVLDRVRMSLLEFDLSGFSNKDTPPPKAQNVLACAIFSEIVKSLGMSYDLSPRQKAMELPGFKYRHDLVRDVLYDVLKRAGISSKNEAPVNFLTDPLEGRSTLQPSGILVFGWAGRKHACVDLTGVSSLVGLKDNEFVAGQAALKPKLSKVAKHVKACLENQHVFIPFAFDTFGFLAPEAEEFLNRVQRVMQRGKAEVMFFVVVPQAVRPPKHLTRRLR
nr:putative reverse transcriptase domain, PPM-type phosphatase domain, protein phosphatase 2C family [Tanacetum cinerariifolium]